MELDFSRLRRGELIVASSASALLALMYLLKWFGGSGIGSVNAWHAMTILRWFMLLTVALSFALVYFQLSRRSPAMAVTLSVIITTLAGLLVILLVYRVLINEPGPDGVTQKPGAFLGLLATIAIAYGGYVSVREEGLAAGDARTEIETIPAERSLGD